jgi:hypothetical protein
LPGGFAGIVHRQDVGVVEPGGKMDFAEKALRAQARGELGVRDLERQRPRVLEILHQVHRGHATTAELVLKPVAMGQ